MSKKIEFFQNCLILDTETNSNDYRVAEVVEAGHAIYSDIWQYTQILYRPENPIPPKVASICYITDRMVKDKDLFSTAVPEWQQVVDSFPQGYFVAHNSFFDRSILERYGIDFKNQPWICTWRLVKKLIKYLPDVEETSLPYLRFALDLNMPEDVVCHRAGVDSALTGMLLEKLVSVMESQGLIDPTQDYGPQVYHYSIEPIIYETMPFGKHQGVPLKDIPVSYWQWAMEKTSWFDETQPNHDPDLAASILKALESE